MGVFGNYPFALAAGLGINGIVAFSLIRVAASRRPGAMGVIVLEGLADHRARPGRPPRGRHERGAARPQASDRAGIGLFILFIGFANGGLDPVGLARRSSRSRSVPARWSRSRSRRPAATSSCSLGLSLTIVLYALKVRAALAPQHLRHDDPRARHRRASIPANLRPRAPRTSRRSASSTSADSLRRCSVRSPRSSSIFSVMLTDFFDTMGTVTGLASRGRVLPSGRLGPGRLARPARRQRRGGRRRTPRASPPTRRTSRAPRASPRAAERASPRS